jgi:glycosyltransferase involved in cell wall biosynthesis
MKQVLVDMHRLRENPYNGLYTFSLELGKALAALPHDDTRLHYYLPKEKFGAFGDKVSYVAQRSIDKFWMQGTNRFDVWHATTNISWYRPFNRKTKFLLTIHDLNFLLEETDVNRRIRLLKIMQGRVDRADHITAISQYAMRTVEENLDLGNKSRNIIYNGCTVNEFPRFDEPVYKPSRPFLFALGLIQPRKNFHLLPALLKGNDYELVIAGLDHFEYKEKIVEAIRKWKVEERVRITGAISEQDKYWYYKNCSAFLFPSFAEGFGLPAIEAMHYGKPVFLSSATCLPEIGGDAAYYFESFEPEAMQARFEKGMNDYSENKPVERIKKRAAHFSWKKAAEEYLALYREL